MKSPVRVSIALVEVTHKLFEKLKADSRLSQSGIIRRALRFYSKNKETIEKHGIERINTYVDMLAHGEHIILDVDHFLLFLKSIKGSSSEDKFWKGHEKVAKSHAEQLSKKVSSPEEYLKRLEACNFFKLSKESETEFTLILFSETTKRFVRTQLEDVLGGMGYEIDIKEDLSKLRLKVMK